MSHVHHLKLLHLLLGAAVLKHNQLASDRVRLLVEAGLCYLAVWSQWTLHCDAGLAACALAPPAFSFLPSHSCRLPCSSVWWSPLWPSAQSSFRPLASTRMVTLSKFIYLACIIWLPLLCLAFLIVHVCAGKRWEYVGWCAWEKKAEVALLVSCMFYFGLAVGMGQGGRKEMDSWHSPLAC